MPISKIPTAFEASIVKWVFIPFAIFAIVFLLVFRIVGVTECGQLCEDNGYSKTTHIPPDRFGSDESAYAKTQLIQGNKRQNWKFHVEIEVA